MTRLQSLVLSYNASASHPASTSLRLPDSWAGLSGLQRLSLSNWKLTAGPPSLWASMQGLRELCFTNMSFCCGTGIVLPAGWSSLTNLVTLVLDNVKGLTGTLPGTWLTGLNSLETLQLSSVPGLNVTRADMDSFLTAPRASGGVRSLALDGFNITGSLFAVPSRYVLPETCA